MAHFRFHLIALVLPFIASTAHGATANITATATIVPPIGITNSSDLNFGASRVLSSNRDVTINTPRTISPSTPTTANARGAVGRVEMSGAAGSTFSTVTMPSEISLSGPSDGVSLTISSTGQRRYGAAGTSGVQSGTGTFSSDGVAVILVGGTLSVGADAKATGGTYAATLPIIVEY